MTEQRLAPCADQPIHPPRHSLGRSGLSVTSMGLGLAALGRPGYINLGHGGDFTDRSVEAMQQRAWQVLDEAWKRGVRYFDVARSYGRAEGFLGSWLRSREVKPDEVTVASKWGYTYTAAWRVNANDHEIKEHSVEVLRRQWVETQAFLGDYLGLYQIHSATFESGVLNNQAVLQQLMAYRAEGVRMGLSLSGPRQGAILRAALAVEVDGLPLFDSVQATFNILESSVAEALREAHDAGLGVVIKEALANGRLTSRNADPGFSVARHALEAAFGAEMDTIALAYVMNQPFVHVVLSGAASVAQMASNSRVSALLEAPLEHALLNELREDPELYWQTRSELAWN